MLPRSLWSRGAENFVTNRITNLCIIVAHSSCSCHLSRSYHNVQSLGAVVLVVEVVVEDVGADGQRNLVGDVGSRQRWNCVGVVDLGEARWHHWRTRRATPRVLLLLRSPSVSPPALASTTCAACGTLRHCQTHQCLPA